MSVELCGMSAALVRNDTQVRNDTEVEHFSYDRCRGVTLAVIDFTARHASSLAFDVEMYAS